MLCGRLCGGVVMHEDGLTKFCTAKNKVFGSAEAFLGPAFTRHLKGQDYSVRHHFQYKTSRPIRTGWGGLQLSCYTGGFGGLKG